MARVAATREVEPIATTPPLHLPPSMPLSKHRHLTNIYRFDL
jgi:hypothetical protein